jgi:DNA-directed RNA polymerase specialized sigma24 family protein
MVIGNGFFSENREAALAEMTERSKCEVKHLPYPTVGNITYYISYVGDLYGQQMIQGRPLTRQRKHQKYSIGYTARLCEAPHKEANFHLQVLTWSAFVLNEWNPDVDLEFKNGNCYDVRPCNLQERVETIPTEWAATMERRKGMYVSHFLDVAWSVNYVTGLPLEDCKDAAQDAFIYLCCEGYMGHQRETDEFIGLWKRVARFRAIDRLKHQEYRQVGGEAYDVVLETHGRHDTGYEFDWFKFQPGEKRQRYLRMFFEGNRPTEIANACGVTLGTVSSNLTRSMQFMQRYFKHEIELWNKIK